ncbi:MAG: M3 family oligoendopeptidase [bacterium]
MKFNDFLYVRPDSKEVMDKLEDLSLEFQNAKSFEEQLDIYKKVEQVLRDCHTMNSIAYVRYTINTNDEFYKAEKDYRDLNSPLIDEKFKKLQNLLLESEFLEDFKKELGEVCITNLKLEVKSFSPEIVDLLQKENELKSKYQTLYASAKVEFDGKTMPLPMLGSYKQSQDRDTRKKAFETEGNFFDSHQKELDSIFDELVKNRAEQARILGYKNYVEMAYDLRNRNCYDAKAVANYRKQILEDIVPLVTKLKANQQERIGVDSLKLYDDTFLFPDGNPTPKGTPDELLALCRKMYNEMSPETSEFIEFMFESDLFDVVSKDGKAPGGYCTSFLNYKAPFIFSNFNGTSGDVDVLTHEAGHAFAGYLAKDLPYLDQMSPTMEGCEVHSMAMEYLTYPWHELFFKEDTNKYTLEQAESCLSFLCYGTMVDYFQELIYSKPEMTPAERNEQWAELDKQFRPYLDFDNLPFYGRGALWQRQLHIYLYPFYYIDYCLASTVALQIQAINLVDSKKAWDTYMTFTKMAGTKTFLDLVTTSGLNSPMEDGCLKSISEKVSDWIFSIKL